MGSLHEGHLSLIDRARESVGADGVVIVTVYVNPTQFGPHEDWSRYPRQLDQDCQLCQARGADAVFAPTDREMYPGQEDEPPASTFVDETALGVTMEGASRPTHFRGVTTVVAKLFNLTQPDVAVFGKKDFQQLAIIRRMTRDLHFPISIIGADTQREPDGLALSSRNQYLSPQERAQAPALWRILGACRERVLQESAPVSIEPLLNLASETMTTEAPLGHLDYLTAFDPQTLRPHVLVTRSSHLAIAVRFGGARLIDNLAIGEAIEDHPPTS